MDGWTDGRTDGRMDGRMDGWMDGWMDCDLISFSTVFKSYKEDVWIKNERLCAIDFCL